MRLYAVENMLEGFSPAVEAHNNNISASVNIAPRIGHLDECRLWCIAEYDQYTRQVTPLLSPELVQWDTRRLRPVEPSVDVRSGSDAETHFQQTVESLNQDRLSQ